MLAIKLAHFIISTFQLDTLTQSAKLTPLCTTIFHHDATKFYLCLNVILYLLHLFLAGSGVNILGYFVGMKKAKGKGNKDTWHVLSSDLL
jgi:hypothetical protein